MSLNNAATHMADIHHEPEGTLEKGLADSTVHMNTSPTTTTTVESIDEGCKKPGFQYVESQLSNSEGDCVLREESQHARSISWIPSLLHLGPLSGLAALLIAFLQVIASFAVLKASDGDEVSNWKYQPSVYLAILTAISNKLIAFAVIQGTVVTFWSRALRGTTLAQLHRDWAFGLHVWKALAAGRNINVLAVACICATFVAVDGPLLQRASSVRSDIPSKPVNLNFAITPEIPSYSTGATVLDGSLGPATTSMQPLNDFLPIMAGYLGQHAMTSQTTGCRGKCNATVRAPALALGGCLSVARACNFTKILPKRVKEAFLDYGAFIPSESINFEVSFMPMAYAAPPHREYIQVDITRTDDAVRKTCVGHLNVTSCWLYSAIAEYPVMIENDIISLIEPPSYPKIVQHARNTDLTQRIADERKLSYGTNAIRTTLSGIAYAASSNFQYSQGLLNIGGKNKIGLVGQQNWFLQQLITNQIEYGNGEDCAPHYESPQDQIFAGLNEIMFRTGLYTAQTRNESWLKSQIDDGLEIYTNVTGTPLTPVDLFASDFHYFAGAAALELFAILAVLLTFHGWWRLGRNFTSSPLEIAKAFDAPLLQHVGSNQNGRQIARVDGERRIMYGVHARPEFGIQRLVIADETSVQRPSSRARTMKEWCQLGRSKLPPKFRRRFQSQAEKENSDC